MHAFKFCRQDSSPVVFRFLSVFLSIYCRHKKKWTSCFFIKVPDKILRKYLSVKSALLNYLYVFCNFFLTEKLNLIKMLKFGRFSFFWLGILCCLQTSRFSLLAESLFPSTWSPKEQTNNGLESCLQILQACIIGSSNNLL